MPYIGFVRQATVKKNPTKAAALPAFGLPHIIPSSGSAAALIGLDGGRDLISFGSGYRHFKRNAPREIKVASPLEAAMQGSRANGGEASFPPNIAGAGSGNAPDRSPAKYSSSTPASGESSLSAPAVSMRRELPKDPIVPPSGSGSVAQGRGVLLHGCGWCGCRIPDRTGRCAACMQVFSAVFGGWAFVTLFIPWSLLAMGVGL